MNPSERESYFPPRERRIRRGSFSTRTNTTKQMIRFFAIVIAIQIALMGIAAGQERTGTLRGSVVDASTQQPLIGSNVTVLGLEHTGTVTDNDGKFVLTLPVGEYNVKVSYIGYKTVVATNVVVSTGRPAVVHVKLQEETVELSGIEVTADYFDKSKTGNLVSAVGLNPEEVRRSPGSAQDMQRIIHTLPGVANSNDQNNELLVRGGAPNENLTVMDYIEIPSTNHYPNEFNSGGPINMVNVDLIEDIQFSSGGFTAQYGDKLSSVMDITIREGDRTRVIGGTVLAHMAGLALVSEGKIGAGGTGSWVLSLRQSLLQVADDILGLSTIGLSSVPKYWDGQFKIAYDLSRDHKLQMSGIYGNDLILLAGESTITKPWLAGFRDSVGINTVDFSSEQFAGGVSLRSLWGNSGFTVLTLSAIGNTYDTRIYSDFTERRFDASGNIDGTSVLFRRTIFDERTRVGETAVKLDAVFRLSPHHELSAGAAYKLNLPYVNRTRWDSDTARVDFNRDGEFEFPRIVRAGADIRLDLPFASESKSFAYVSDRITMIPRVIVNAGLRYDHFTYSGAGNLSPRVSASYLFLPPSTSLNLSYGEFYQTQPWPLYIDPQNTEINRRLDNSHARHVVIGVEHLFGNGLKAGIEAYEKRYARLPVRETFLHHHDRTFRSDRILAIGEGTARGVEFFLQQKMVDDFYGTLSYSYSATRLKDKRVRPTTDFYPSSYDYPHIVTLVYGKMIHGARSWLDTKPWYVRFPSVLLPFSDDMEFSLRWRFASGRPFTPRTFERWEQHREGGVRWSEGTWVETENINAARLPDYHRLDLLWLSRWHHSGWNIVLFLSVWNLYGQDNVAMYRYNDDGTMETIHQWGFFPIGGFQVEF